MSESDIYEILKELKDNGLGISVVCGVDDDVFLMESIQREYSMRKTKGDFRKAGELMDGFYSVRGTHGEFIGHGEKVDKHLFPKAVHQALIALEKKSEKKNE